MALVAVPSESSQLCRTGPAWLPHKWGDNTMLTRLLEAANSLRENGSIQQRTTEAFREAYALHVKENDQMHLAFSATLPLFFEALRAGERGGINAECGSGQLAFHKDHSESSVPACIALLEMLQSLCRFGDRPPACPPEDWSKWQYVRELCSQAALSLDVARLVYLEQRTTRRRKSADPPKPVLHDAAQEADPDASSQAARGQLVLDPDSARLEAAPDAVQQSAQVVRTGSRSFADTGRQGPDARNYNQIRQDALVRAGRFLKALQEPMDQLKEDHEKLLHASAVDTGLEVRDVLFPCFGKFLEEQLLPLYIRDLTLSTLGEAGTRSSCHGPPCAQHIPVGPDRCCYTTAPFLSMTRMNAGHGKFWV